MKAVRKALQQRSRPQADLRSDIRLPYDVLLIVFRHVSDLDKVEEVLRDCATTLADSYTSLNVSILSPFLLKRAKNDLKSCARVSLAWREACLSILESVSSFATSSRSHRPLLVPEKIKICRWLDKLEETSARRGSSDRTHKDRLKRISSGSSQQQMNVLPDNTLSLSSFTNLQVLVLGGLAQSQLRATSGQPTCPLAELRQLQTLIICNYEAVDRGAKPATGKALDMADVVYWVRGSHIKSLELFDVSGIIHSLNKY